MKRGWSLWGPAAVLTLLVVGGVRFARKAAAPRAEPTTQPEITAKETTAKKGKPTPPQVRTLYEHPTSAYHARLFVEEDEVVLVTQAGFTTLRQGSPPEEHPLPMAQATTRRGPSVVFWRSEKLWEAPVSGDGERELAPLPNPPQFLLASERHLVWIHTGRGAPVSVQVLTGGEVRRVSEVPGHVRAAALRGDAVFLVLQSAQGGAWKIGRVSLAGADTVATRARRGRPPAMLALGTDGVYFYDGPKRGVRRATFALDREEAVSTNLVCSPLVVSSRVVCAYVGGLFDIPPAAAAPRLLAAERAGPITAMAATYDRVYWVAERGKGLVVRSVALPDLDARGQATIPGVAEQSSVPAGTSRAPPDPR